MLQKSTLVSLIAGSLLIASCHKSNSNSNGGGSSSQLVGNYTFLYVSLNEQSTTTTSAAGETAMAVSSTDYTSTQNTGTVTFTSDSLSSNEVGYTINSTTSYSEYENNSLITSGSEPFSFTEPATSSATKYEVIGQDSLYFNGGYPVSVAGSTTVAPPSGGRFSFKGDTLFIVSTVLETTSQSISGATESVSVSGVATIAMLKQ